MLRISPIEPVNHSVTLRLEGRLVGPWVAEARAAIERLLAEGRTLKLDLAETAFIDEAGLALLLNLQARGAVLVECAPFVEAQLNAARATR